MARTPNPHAMGDLGRRVAARRARLGLSRQDVAERTGSTPGYIAYVEEEIPNAGPGFLARLANALETTVEDLAGYTADLPQGGERAGRDPHLEEVGTAECWELLDDHGVGRVAVHGRDGLTVFPVNYQVVREEIVFLTARDSVLARAAATGEEVAFEQDRLDEAFSQGWSVLAVGTVDTVPDADEAALLREASHSQPWAGGERGTVVVLSPRRVTGRRIRVPGAPGNVR